MANRNANIGSARTVGLLDPRNGAQKKTQGAPPPHSGMAHTVAPDVLARGVSRTESARLLGNDQVGEIHGGAVTGDTLLKSSQKQTGNVPNKPGMKNNSGAIASTAKLPDGLSDSAAGPVRQS